MKTPSIEEIRHWRESVKTAPPCETSLASTFACALLSIDALLAEVDRLRTPPAEKMFERETASR